MSGPQVCLCRIGLRDVGSNANIEHLAKSQLPLIDQRCGTQNEQSLGAVRKRDTLLAIQSGNGVLLHGNLCKSLGEIPPELMAFSVTGVPPPNSPESVHGFCRLRGVNLREDCGGQTHYERSNFFDANGVRCRVNKVRAARLYLKPVGHCHPAPQARSKR
jgi:hypothetical protein